MKISDIKEIARNKEVKLGKTNKVELIRAIQRAEGNYNCFATPYVHECSLTSSGAKICRKEDSMKAVRPIFNDSSLSKGKRAYRR